ncbi:MAG: hypothetical protein ACI9S6_002360, partial [Reinekea sp.]
MRQGDFIPVWMVSYRKKQGNMSVIYTNSLLYCVYLRALGFNTELNLWQSKNLPGSTHLNLALAML